MLTDAALQATVVDALASTPEVDSSHIGVSSHAGAVTLTGEVESYPELRRAERAVLAVPGVSAVAQELTVSCVWAPATDADIALLTGGTLASDAVKASVHDHTVTLSGTVPTVEARTAAEHSVRHLRGVVGVVNAITVAPD
jgi:osmotically-inducible protein OsmY